ncbi:MAG TPA: SRPBCC domain-containing protein [Edaphobacter sp.]|uniref:SRPBCC family protein n=1 Tax=Edaphobacter sp. TaxID=1934404 RepID=UPI002CB25AFB|nr:SRPBCC domain-containing protein [Edaphobacter sp.]HUZ95055.1 SRPBCC domain-containing protein [Edaphobacter sp.]
MAAGTSEQTIQSLEVIKDELIAASIEIVFESVLEQLGPLNETPDGSSLSMKLEAWPGGRWYRDLGNNTGHFWGHVQAIKPPTLLEICGPLFMSQPAVSNVQYRLTEENGLTRLRFVHRASGMIPAALTQGDRSVSNGWGYIVTKIREAAERRSSKGLTRD